MQEKGVLGMFASTDWFNFHGVAPSDADKGKRWLSEQEVLLQRRQHM